MSKDKFTFTNPEWHVIHPEDEATWPPHYKRCLFYQAGVLYCYFYGSRVTLTKAKMELYERRVLIKELTAWKLAPRSFSDEKDRILR